MFQWSQSFWHFLYNDTWPVLIMCSLVRSEQFFVRAYTHPTNYNPAVSSSTMAQSGYRQPTKTAYLNLLKEKCRIIPSKNGCTRISTAFDSSPEEELF